MVGLVGLVSVIWGFGDLEAHEGLRVFDSGFLFGLSGVAFGV